MLLDHHVLSAASHLVAAPPPLARACIRCIEDSDPILATIERDLMRWHAPGKEPPPPMLHVVTADEDGERVTSVVGRAFESLGSKSQARAAMKRGALLVNDVSVETSRRVRAGDVLALQQAATPPPSAAKLRSVSRFVAHLRTQGLRTPYEDDQLAVVFKPPGIHTKVNHRRSHHPPGHHPPGHNNILS